jgi:hypothetical protein
MKYVYIILLVIFTVNNVACNPSSGKDIFTTEIVKLSATILSNAENITLGDTIKINFKVPDTVITSGSTQIVRSLQRVQFGMEIDKIDTISKRGTLMMPPLTWVSKGSNEGNLSFVTSTIYPYELQINFKPIESGLYSIKVIYQAGQFRINNNFEGRLSVNFNVPNKHLNILSLISPYFGGQAYYNAVIQKDNDGFGVYFFRVI